MHDAEITETLVRATHIFCGKDRITLLDLYVPAQSGEKQHARYLAVLFIPNELILFIPNGHSE